MWSQCSELFSQNSLDIKIEDTLTMLERSVSLPVSGRIKSTVSGGNERGCMYRKEIETEVTTCFNTLQDI